MYKYLSAVGWTQEAICGLFGNIHRESHFNPGVWQNKDLMAGTAQKGSDYGLVQWTPSGEKFLAWAGFTKASDANNMALNDPR
ncbi:phage tail-type lysozyme domain-containing protein [Lachnospiraceae bacterium OttesenSCG-928-D06]|nr:phage tail-type lysozyme domain-containing protein [Lachnospiraceae bacterium OttesenSCG-928-D06]